MLNSKLLSCCDSTSLSFSASGLSRVICSIAALSVTSANTSLAQSLVVVLFVFPVLLTMGLLPSFNRIAQIGILPIFLILSIAWGLIVQGRPGLIIEGSSSDGFLFAAEFSARLLLLCEIVVILWRSISIHDSLRFICSMTSNQQVRIALAVALFTFQFTRFETRRTVEALAARGAIRGRGIVGRLIVVPVVLTNIWIPALRVGIRRANIKWIPQNTISRGIHLEEKYISNPVHSGLVLSMAGALFFLTVSTFASR